MSDDNGAVPGGKKATLRIGGPEKDPSNNLKTLGGSALVLAVLGGMGWYYSSLPPKPESPEVTARKAGMLGLRNFNADIQSDTTPKTRWKVQFPDEVKALLLSNQDAGDYTITGNALNRDPKTFLKAARDSGAKSVVESDVTVYPVTLIEYPLDSDTPIRTIKADVTGKELRNTYESLRIYIRNADQNGFLELPIHPEKMRGANTTLGTGNAGATPTR